MKAIISMNRWNLPDLFYQADKADKADNLRKTPRTRVGMGLGQ